MSLMDLAQAFDSLDPEKDWEKRIEIGEKMKAQLGDHAEDFEQRYERMLSTAEKAPAAAVVRSMGLR